MPNAYGHRLRLRLFLEGVEVPVISANVRSAPNSPSVAAIQIPPLPEGTRFLPRTLVHLFFLDLYEQESPLVREIQVNTPDRRSPTAHERALQSSRTEEQGSNGEAQSEESLKDADNSRYKLMFGGEVVGFQWTKNQAQRSLVLQCLDWSNYWDYAYQWNNTGIFGPGIKAIFSGGASNLFTDFLSSKGAVITRIVASGKCNAFPRLKGLAAGIIRLIEAIGGTYFPPPGSTAKKIAGQNLFFSTAELRLHITHMIAALEEDATSSKILRRQGYFGMFSRILGNLGGQVSIRKSINSLTGVMFHETYGQTCPKYEAGERRSVNGVVRTKLSEDPRLKSLSSKAQNALRQVTSAKDQIQELIGDETISSAPGIDVGDGTVFSPAGVGLGRATAQSKLAGAKQNCTSALVPANSSNAPKQAEGLLSQAIGYISRASTLLISFAFDGPIAQATPLLAALDNAAARLRQLVNLTVPLTRPIIGQPARLNQHILRPDVWFTAPPRCNVLFPEDYDTVTYQRMFLQEPTRFMLKTNDEFFGEDFLFDKFYFAPQAGSVRNNKARLRDMMRGDTLDHELFTGILPVFEKMGEFNVFAARSGTRKGTQKIGFAQRSANFLYFKHRYAARQMRVSGKFNPYIAIGFPGLIIDKYVDQTTIRTYNDLIERENERRVANNENELTPSRVLGTNFLANFTEVSHHVSQAEATGRTEINCGYARQPDETVEFLGREKTTVAREQDQAALRATDVAALNAPKLGSLGPSQGKIVNVTEVTDQYVRVSGGRSLPVFGGPRRERGGQFRPARVPIGVPISAGEVGSPDVQALVGSRDREVIFRAFRVDEEIPRFRREQVDLPAEEIIRPGWYGEVWTNSKIGQAYNTFFGIGSITDKQTAVDSSIGTRSVQSEERADAQSRADQAQTETDPRLDLPLVADLDEGSTIQQAVDFLLLTYSYARLSGNDIDQFVRSYTWRPIATMVDMFGTSDLQFDEKGERVLQGFEGFHSRAFGFYDNLFGLVGPDLQDILGVKRGSTAAMRADTRKRKRMAVQAYVSALLFSRGLLG